MTIDSAWIASQTPGLRPWNHPLRFVLHVRCACLADRELEFEYGIILAWLGKLQEDLSPLPHYLPLLLLHPGTQEAIAAVDVAETPGMCQCRQHLDRRQVTRGQYSFF